MFAGLTGVSDRHLLDDKAFLSGASRTAKEKKPSFYFPSLKNEREIMEMVLLFVLVRISYLFFKPLITFSLDVAVHLIRPDNNLINTLFKSWNALRSFRKKESEFVLISCKKIKDLILVGIMVYLRGWSFVMLL